MSNPALDNPVHLDSNSVGQDTIPDLENFQGVIHSQLRSVSPCDISERGKNLRFMCWYCSIGGVWAYSCWCVGQNHMRTDWLLLHVSTDHFLKLGHNIIDFVSDIHHAESTRTVRNTTWGLCGTKEEWWHAQNTIGYHSQGAEELQNTKDQPSVHKKAEFDSWLLFYFHILCVGILQSSRTVVLYVLYNFLVPAAGCKYHRYHL